MNQQEFEYLAHILKERSGLSLSVEKGYLLESRLRSVARVNGHEDLSSMIQAMQATSPSEALLKEITEAMTTNESMFFRDNKPFVSLKEKILPAMKPHLTGGKLDIWSAACSNGQEPYSLAMMLEEEKGSLGGLNYNILGTDLDTLVLKKAQQGNYTQFEVQRGLSIQVLLKYFSQIEGNEYQIQPNLKQSINFKQYNLLDPFTPLGSFDIIMCRNVLIYFDEATKKNVLERMCGVLKPHGVIFLGSAETVIGITDKLKPISGDPGIFLLKDSVLEF